MKRHEKDMTEKETSINGTNNQKNELLGFLLAATTAVCWVTGSVGVQGLNQTIPHFELSLIRLSGM